VPDDDSVVASVLELPPSLDVPPVVSPVVEPSALLEPSSVTEPVVSATVALDVSAPLVETPVASVTETSVVGVAEVSAFVAVPVPSPLVVSAFSARPSSLQAIVHEAATIIHRVHRMLMPRR
jgi:hypothetical protein